jgi:hypothetical protein
MQKAAGIRQQATSMMSPDAWKKWWAARNSRLDNAAFVPAGAALGALLSKKGMKNLLVGEMPLPTKQAQEKAKTIAAETSNITKELPDANDRAQAFFAETDPDKKEAIWRSLASSNDLGSIFSHAFQEALGPLGQQLKELSAQKNTLENSRGSMSDEQYNSQLTKLNASMKELVNKPESQTKINNAKKDFTMNPQNLQKFMLEKFGQQRGTLLGNDTQMMLANNGNIAFSGSWRRDSNTGQLVTNLDANKRIAAVVNKLRDSTPKDFWNKVRPETFFEKGYSVSDEGEIKYDFTGFSESAKELIKNLNADHIDQFGNKQNISPQLLEAFNKNIEKIRNEGDNGKKLAEMVEEKLGKRKENKNNGAKQQNANQTEFSF